MNIRELQYHADVAMAAHELTTNYIDSIVENRDWKEYDAALSMGVATYTAAFEAAKAAAKARDGEEEPKFAYPLNPIGNGEL
jgi:hypothetical protein